MLMRHLLLLVTVAVVMAAMMVAMAAPAIAYHGGPGPEHRPCLPGEHVQNVQIAPGGEFIGYECVPNGNGPRK
jgi:hypothetical protein